MFFYYIKILLHMNRLLLCQIRTVVVQVTMTGILDNLQFGDVIMIDRGFTIAQEVGERECTPI
jgi:hypothetical protein